MLPKIVLTLWIMYSAISGCITCRILLCTLSQYLRRGNDCILPWSELGRRSVLILANQRDSSFIFFIPPLAQRLGLSGPLVRIIMWLLAASQLQMKFEQQRHRMAAADVSLKTLEEMVLSVPQRRIVGCFLERQRHAAPQSSLSPLGYFEVVLSQLLYLWWQPVQSPSTLFLFLLWPLVLVRSSPCFFRDILL